MSQEPKKFKLAIVMAGAVSAGAYTGGVMDYLIECLQEWEKKKKKNLEKGSDDPDYDYTIPMHDVEITVLGGTSAGGMTAAMALAALHGEHPSISPEKRDNSDYKKKNKLYDGWVNLTGDEVFRETLDTDDIGKDVASLLNSTFIDVIAERIMKDIPELGEKSFVNPEMEVFLTLSNLRGFDFSYGFKGGERNTNKFRTKRYLDYAHFQLAEMDNDNGRIPLSFSANENVDLLKDAAKSTGAFPVGLKSREVRRDPKHINENEFINPLHRPNQIPPVSEPIAPQRSDSSMYVSQNVDGGLLNNEPFDFGEKVLLAGMKDYTIENHGSAEKTEAALLMIDPFPSEKEEDGAYTPKPDLLSVAKSTFAAMRNQLLYSEEKIEAVLDEEDYSKYMIAPTRTDDYGNRIQGSRAMACGALGGFSGFFDIQFREHDFYLGRRNAQKFLRTHFAIDESGNNVILKEGYASDKAKDRFRIKESDGTTYLPIIPDLTGSDGEQYWNNKKGLPAYDYDKLNRLKGPLKKRIGKIIPRLLKAKGTTGVLVNIGTWAAKGRLAKSVLKEIEEEFKEEWNIPEQ